MWCVHLIVRGFVFPLFFALVSGVARQVPSPPKIVKQPPHEQLFQMSDLNTPITRPVILECEATGPEIKYKWKKNGNIYTWSTDDDRVSMQPGRGTLVIATPKDIDEALFQCFAENSYGIAVSNSVYLRKAELNPFAGSPDPITTVAKEGESLTLKCTPPSGLPPPTIFWVIQSENGALDSINNSRITVDPEGYLHFSNVTVIDGRRDKTYACSAHSQYRQEYKLGNFVKLRVIPSGGPMSNKQGPIKQYTSPTEILALRQHNKELYCIFGGTPLPEVKWSRRNGKLPEGRYSITNFGKTLKLYDIEFEDEGLYECSITNGVGQALSHAMKITVQSEPYWIKEPLDANRAEEETVTFICQANGIPEPRIQWFVNGTPIEKVYPNPRRFVSTNNITIVDLKKEIDTDVYQCNASNVHGYVFANAYVNVLALPPEIIQPPENLTESVQEKDVIISCRVFGAPNPVVSWEKDKRVITGGRFKVLGTGDLQISKVENIDKGEYTCSAVNKFGAKTGRGVLDIKDKTKIVTAPESLEVRAGDTAVFRCSAVSDSSLDLTIKWLREGTPINYDADQRLYLSNDNSLSVTTLQELDSGTYTCLAQTRLDNETANAELVVQDVPNRPAGLSVECKSQNAMLRWKAMGDNRAPILNYIIQHNTTFEPDNWVDLTSIVPATESSFQVSLSPWVNYTFRVLARNKIGLSPASDISTPCLTPQDVPYKNPENVHGRGRTPHDLVIYWTRMPQIEHNAPGFYYLVEYQRTEGGDVFHSVKIPDWTNNSLVIDQQETYKRYRIKVWAYNSIGRANVEATTVLGFSGEDVPSQAPTEFQLTKIIGPNSARFTWQAVPPSSVNGEFKGYKIQTWKSSDKPDENMREMPVNANETSAVAKIFIPNSENNVRIVVYNGQHDGPPSPIITFSTPEGVPGPVKSFNAYPLGPSSLWIKWDTPDELNGVLRGYKMYYRKVVGLEMKAIEDRSGIISPDRVSAKISGLEEDTNYRIYIKGFTNKGEGEENFSEARTEIKMSAADLEALPVPGKPEFEVYNITKNGLYVRWIPTVDKEEVRSGQYFYVQHKRPGEARWQPSPYEQNEDYTAVTNLDPGTTYVMRIVSVEGSRETPSDEREIITNGQRPLDGDNTDSVSTAGWFVGMMCAIAFLLLVLIIVCVIKKNRGGKYSVHEKEEAQGRDLEKADDGSFNEYSKPVDDVGKGSQTSLNSSVKGPESETDSMAEYGDGETAKFTEDGSFIGQYGAAKKKKEPDQDPDTTSPSALSTFV